MDQSSNHSFNSSTTVSTFTSIQGKICNSFMTPNSQNFISNSVNFNGGNLNYLDLNNSWSNNQQQNSFSNSFSSSSSGSYSNSFINPYSFRNRNRNLLRRNINLEMNRGKYFQYPIQGMYSTENLFKFNQDESNFVFLKGREEDFKGKQMVPPQKQKVNTIYNKLIDYSLNINLKNNNCNNSCTSNINKINSSSLGFDMNKCELEEFTQRLKSISMPLEQFLCTRKGPKDMIKLIDKYPKACITIILNTLSKNITQVMKDNSGNYFCQNLINRSSKKQLTLILNYISQDFVSIAKDYQGTHVLQTLVEKISGEDDEKKLIIYIKDKELEMALDLNASHVLQKIIKKVIETKRDNINEIFLKNFYDLATNAIGVCCLKVFIFYNITPFIQEKILNLISNNLLKIANDRFGNYIIQTVLEKWGLIVCNTIVNKLIKNICALSVKKISANVSKRLIEIIDDYNFKFIIKELFFSKKFSLIIKNKYGRYVLQNCIKRMNYEEMKIIYDFVDKNEYFIKNDPDNKIAIMNSLFKNITINNKI